MNAIVAGKQEKQTGSLIFKTEETAGLWVNSITFNTSSSSLMASKHIKIVDLNGRISIISAFSCSSDSYTYTNIYPIIGDNTKYLRIHLFNQNTWIGLYMVDPSASRIYIGNYFSDIEFGTLE